MVQTLALSQNIATLTQLREKFNLVPTEDAQFFYRIVSKFT